MYNYIYILVDDSKDPTKLKDPRHECLFDLRASTKCCYTLLIYYMGKVSSATIKALVGACDHIHQATSASDLVRR